MSLSISAKSYPKSCRPCLRVFIDFSDNFIAGEGSGQAIVWLKCKYVINFYSVDTLTVSQFGLILS